MKKITLLITFLMTSIGFSQTELLTNGDFSNGATNWALTGGSVVSNEAAFATTASGGNPWDTQLVQGGFSFTNTQEYTVTFSARADVARDITVAIQNVGVWTDQFRQDFSLTTSMATYTATFNATVTNANVQIGFLMAGFGVTHGVYYDDISLSTPVTSTCSNGVKDGDETGVDCGGSCAPCAVPPATAAAIQPARAVADVVSVFSDEYTNVTPSGLETFGSATYTNFTIANTDDTRRLTATANGEGMQYLFLTGSPLDLSSFTNMHIDFYVEGPVQASQELQVFLHNFSAWPSGAGSTKLFKNFDVNAIGSGAWYTVDLALNTFNDTPLTRDKISLIQIVVNGGAGVPAFGPVYIDNIYFHKNTTLATKNFEIAGLNVYPNPAKNSWNVRTSNINMSAIKVYDILGKNVLSLTPNATDVTINGSSLKAGLYFAQIKTANGVSSIKLVKE